MKNGIYSDISNRDYHSLDMVSNSYLNKLAIYPAKALIESGDTEAMAVGRAFHVYILEPELFDKEVVILPEINRRTNDGKAEYARFLTEHSLKTIISIGDMANIREMRLAIERHPLASKMIKDGISEQTVIWTDNETGLPCKARPDRIPDGKGVLVDLKKTRDASAHGFQSSVVKYRYAQQAAMYIDGIMHATEGKKMYDAFAFIAVEDKEPYRTEVYTLNLSFLAWGYAEYRQLLKLERECRDNNFWPHYQNPGAVELEKPSYLQEYEGE